MLKQILFNFMKRWRTNNHWAGWFYDETYRANIDIIWPVNGLKVEQYVKDRYDTDYECKRAFGAKCIEITNPNGTQANIICLTSWSKPDATDYSFLAHECFHATSHILSVRGLPLQDYVSSEAYAFLLESIMRRCLTILDTRRPIR